LGNATRLLDEAREALRLRIVLIWVTQLMPPFGCERRGPGVSRASEITDRGTRRAIWTTCLRYDFQWTLNVCDTKAARKGCTSRWATTLVKSFSSPAQEVLKTNVDSPIRFDEHACATPFGRRQTARNSPGFSYFFHTGQKKRTQPFG